MADTMHADIINAQNGLLVIINKRKNLLLALCLEYAGRALKIFRDTQPSAQDAKGSFDGEDLWTNRTVTARNLVFSDAEATKQFMGFFLAHGVQYGIYLELANDRKYEVLRPIVYSLYEPFIDDIKKIFGDST